MSRTNQRLRVLYSFPHRIGHERICYTAWEQVRGLAAARAEVLVFPGSVHRDFPAQPNIRIQATLARGKWRIPYRALGRLRALAMHDWIVARRIEKLAGQIDVIHVWPLGARETLKAAARLGIPTVMERPNAHTRFAYEVTRKECDRLGVPLPAHHEHAFNAEILRIEEEEYRRADYLLCPSDFVIRTFLEQGFPPAKLLRHQYGYDDKGFYPNRDLREPKRGLTMLFVGGCAPRKGLHYALEAWLKSSAHRDGTFLIAGGFVPGYAEKLSAMLDHPSVRVLGHRNDIPGLMRKSDLLTLPSIEEGFGLVCTEAMGSGCVPLVSDACTDMCKHMENALVHRVGDVPALTQHINMLCEDRALLERLRSASLESTHEITWDAAGVRLLQVYREAIAAYSERAPGGIGAAQTLAPQAAVPS